MPLIINDENADLHVRENSHLCGCLPRREVYGAIPGVSADPIDLIPYEEWPDRIADMERQKSQVYHAWLDSELGVLNQGQLSYCFPSGTQILMANGSSKEIQDIRAEESVVTAEANIGRVVQTMTRFVSEPLYEIFVNDHGYLRATSEHPVLTKRGYVPINEVVVGDDVTAPSAKNDNQSWKTVLNIGQHDYSGTVFNLSVEGDNSYVANGIGVHNCWAFSSVMGLMLERLLQGFPYLHLSPSSVGAPLVGYKNTGYYIEEALKRMISDGASTTEFVPEATTNAADFKPGWKESAGMNKVTMWRDVGNDPQAQGSMLLQRKPLPIAVNWWGHAILACRLIDRNKNLPASNPLRYSKGFLNSWSKSYGTDGYAELDGYKAIADAAYAIEQAKFTS